jgi:hypothetical protein
MANGNVILKRYQEKVRILQGSQFLNLIFMTVTLEYLQAIGDNYQAIEFARGEMIDYPERVKKPSLKNNPTSQDAEEFALNLKQYEKDIELYNNSKKEVQEYNSKIDDILIEFIKEASGLNSIPEQYRDKVYYEVLGTIQNLVEIFE